MPDTPIPPTRRLCPACGMADVRPKRCSVCGDGKGLATPDQIREWSERQRARHTTSSLRTVPTQARDALAALRKRGTAQTAPLITVGEELLARAEADPGEEKTANRLAEWLTAVQALLAGSR